MFNYTVFNLELQRHWMTTEPGLTYQDELSGPRERTAIRRLLFDIFDLDISPIEELGLTDPTYRAFSYLDGTGCCVANAATFTLPLIIGGKRVNAMGIQSVATRPAWRRRGLSHDLLRRALQWCDSNARLTFLMTLIPGFYEPMGFRIVPQFAYVGRAPAASPVRHGCRRLDLNLGEDRRLLARVLRNRTPVSTHFAVDGSAGAFVLSLFDQTDFAAWYIESKDAVVVTAERSDGVLCVVDVAAAMPTLQELVAALGEQATQVEVHFPPDQLAWTGVAVAAQTSTFFMVRGDLESVAPFMFPETAAF
jgi:GNAT superfamily N-acetyltransferase